jgi:hypothetical protein
MCILSVDGVHRLQNPEGHIVGFALRFWALMFCVHFAEPFLRAGKWMALSQGMPSAQAAILHV